MDIIQELKLRGILKDCSNETKIKQQLKEGTTIYCGFDPSFHSLHMGNYLLISLLSRLQKRGQRIVVLCGGATGMIGDPSGKSKERSLLNETTLKKNIAAITKQLSRFINLDHQNAVMVNNYDWIGKISFLEFLRDYGKHFSVNYLLAKDVIKSRLEGGISYTEFSYSLIQATDFLHLYETMGVKMQVGGSDQWGNMTAGLELIRKVKGEEAPCEVFTANLIMNSSGQKFGKSEAGALFLDEELTSPYQLYQYFINVDDADAIRYLKLFTFLSLDEIEKIEKNHVVNLGERLAQKLLAKEIVSDVHGTKAYENALKLSRVLFEGDPTTVSERELQDLFNSNITMISSITDVFSLLVTAKITSSNRETREFIQAGALRINNHLVTADTKLEAIPLLFNKYYFVKKGKKNNFLIKIN